jgi:hypothetical protein
VENVAGQAFGVDADERRLFGIDLAAGEREVVAAIVVTR